MKQRFDEYASVTSSILSGALSLFSSSLLKDVEINAWIKFLIIILTLILGYFGFILFHFIVERLWVRIRGINCDINVYSAMEKCISKTNFVREKFVELNSVELEEEKVLICSEIKTANKEILANLSAISIDNESKTLKFKEKYLPVMLSIKEYIEAIERKIQ